jgi:ATP-dependent Zn protease
VRGYETARQIVATNRAAVRGMADELLVVESLDAEGIRSIIASAAAGPTSSQGAEAAGA